MIKLTGLALMAAVAFAITPAFAAAKEKDKNASCCTADGSCAKSYAKLKLTPEQKTKMDAAMAKCKTAGCTKESAAEFMKSAEGILSKEQMAAFHAECAKHEKKA
jgi:Spy/CpxP family protein refolding chaperone